MRLSKRLQLEREQGYKLKPLFENKEWKYCKYNNEFLKNNIIAYIYYPYIIFHFNLFEQNKTYHRLCLEK